MVGENGTEGLIEGIAYAISKLDRRVMKTGLDIADGSAPTVTYPG